MKQKALKALYVIPIAFLESLTVSFYKNVKKRMSDKKAPEYMEIRVPEGYKDKKLQPDYPELSASKDSDNPFSSIFGP